MFKLIAAIVLIIAGQPDPDTIKMASNVKFATLEDCVAFKDGPAGAKSLENLNAMLDARLPEDVKHTATVACEKMADDGSI